MHGSRRFRRPIVTRVELNELLRGLDAEQHLAVVTDAAPLAIIAAAGSGKTTVLTRRIARRIRDGSADPRHILAITFTRDAAGELRRRLRRLDIREQIESGTFHAVCLRLLRDRALTTGSRPPVVAPDRMRLLREVLTETRVQCSAAAAMADIDWARARLIDPSSFAEASRRARRRTSLRSDEFVRVVDHYESLKRRRGVVDFDDLLSDVLVHIERDSTFAEIVRWRFRHLFVDEVQDLNPLQFSVLEQIRGNRSDICLVGDPRQAIYGWNGADPSLLADIDHHLPGVTIVALTGNYRCSPQIVRAGAAALSSAAIRDDTESLRADGRRVQSLACVDEVDEARRVAHTVRDLAERHGARHVAVLARTNEQLSSLGAALGALDIAVTRAVGTSPLERALTEVSRCANREQIAAWIESVWADRQSDEGVDPIRSRVAEEADRFLTSNEPGGFRAWVDARQPFDDLEPLDEGAVSLLTFHSAKGREWRGVVVAGVEVGLVPHASASSPEQRSEEARLLYVALTRAADELIITSAAQRSGQAAGPSPWLASVMATNDHERTAAPPTALLLRGHRTTVADPIDQLRAWRAGVARSAGVAETAVCADSVLRTLVDDPPADIDALSVRLGVGRAAAERLAPALFSHLSQHGRASSTGTVPGPSR